MPRLSWDSGELGYLAASLCARPPGRHTGILMSSGSEIARCFAWGSQEPEEGPALDPVGRERSSLGNTKGGQMPTALRRLAMFPVLFPTPPPWTGP